MVRRGRWAVVCAAALLVMVGCGQRQAQYGPDFTSAEELPEKLSTNGITIMVGDPDAPVTVHLYEDPRCPYCEEFETTGGSSHLREAVLDRWARVEYTLASFLDDRVGGSGSKKAVNALRAALEAGKFVEYHEVLYANQPDESVDGYTDASLLELAGQVEGLRGPEFDAAVRSMKYRSFVTSSQKAYEEAGGTQEPEGPGTPTAVINGKRIPLEYNALLLQSDAFAELLQKVHDEPGEWQDTKL
ncbi:protein-disulfide isomerase [Streptomyces achromogenes]|uniref:Protein-disulfide isomerase n=1 Tax=Streptomyces achromogenes TaxID=67255 RepID=A0ABU0QE50_STRAH|nr:protein-disulfide isomerase [Streptomyces achromogenes]